MIIFVALITTIVNQQNQLSRIEKNEEKRLHEKYCGSGKAVDIMHDKSNNFGPSKFAKLVQITQVLRTFWTTFFWLIELKISQAELL